MNSFLSNANSQLIWRILREKFVQNFAGYYEQVDKKFRRPENQTAGI